MDWKSSNFVDLVEDNLVYFYLKRENGLFVVDAATEHRMLIKALGGVLET